jgi:hypothetical protein
MKGGGSKNFPRGTQTGGCKPPLRNEKTTRSGGFPTGLPSAVKPPGAVDTQWAFQQIQEGQQIRGLSQSLE